MKKYLKLLRVKHYIKNILIFLPLVFSLNLTNFELVFKAVLGFIAFCAMASFIYIFNDIRDIEQDRKHSIKHTRPLAIGEIKKNTAIMLAAISLLFSMGLIFYLNNLSASILILSYLIINLLYSMGLKKVPIIEIVLLASGFVIRVLFGGAIIGVSVSQWLLCNIIAASFYMGLGKRRNEILVENENTREVNRVYTKEFLDKNMYVCVTLTIVFYSLWCINSESIVNYANEGIFWSIPIVIVIFMRYSFIIEQKKDGDPTNILLSDWFLLALVAFFAIMLVTIIYVPLDFLNF